MMGQAFWLKSSSLIGAKRLFSSICILSRRTLRFNLTPAENALPEAFKRGRKQGASTLLLEIVAPNLPWKTVEKVAKKQLGKRIKKRVLP
jgi:hypothetical protein